MSYNFRQLGAQWKAEQVKTRQTWRTFGKAYTELLLTPRKMDVRVTQFGLAWTPFWRLTYADRHVETVAAYVR